MFADEFWGGREKPKNPFEWCASTCDPIKRHTCYRQSSKDVKHLNSPELITRVYIHDCTETQHLREVGVMVHFSVLL